MTDVQKIAFDTLKSGAPGLSDQTREALARSIARKVALSNTPARAEAAPNLSDMAGAIKKLEAILAAYSGADKRLALESGIAALKREIARAEAPSEDDARRRLIQRIEQWDSETEYDAEDIASLADDILHEFNGAPVTDCKTCAGNGEIVTDWDRYLGAPQPGDQGDEGTADCPDCGGIGKVDVARAEAQDEGAAGEIVAWDSDVLDTFGGYSQNVLTRTPYVAKTGERVRSQTPLYAHPSPTPAADADRVRIAVEALDGAYRRWVSAEGESVDVLERVGPLLEALKSTAAKEGGE